MGEDEELSAGLARSGRRIKMVVAAFGVLLAAGVAAAVGWVLTRPDPLCDEEEVETLLSRSEIPAVAAHRACDFPEPLAEGLRGMEAAPPSYRDLQALRVASDAPELLTAVCPDAPSLVAAAGRTGSPDPIIEGCDLSAIAPEDRLASASVPRLVLAIAVYGSLEQTDGDLAPRLARAMLE